MASSNLAPSDTKSIAWALVGTRNDNVTDEYQGFSDATFTTKSFQLSWIYDNISVGSASGSNYKVLLPLTSNLLLVNTTAAETWIETMYSNAFDLTIGSVYTTTEGAMQYYGLWNLSGTTFKQADAESSAYPTVLDDIDYIKK